MGFSYTESWCNLGSIHIARRLSIADVCYFYDNPVVVEIPEGEYVVLVKVITMGEVAYISEVVVIDVDHEHYSIGETQGILAVDFAQAGICDRDKMEELFRHEGTKKFFEKLKSAHLTGPYRLTETNTMMLTSTGFGDGEYEVKEILSENRKRIGITVTFVSNDELNDPHNKFLNANIGDIS